MSVAVPAQYDGTVTMASAQYGVPKDLLAAVLETESGWDPNAVSSAGAEGIAQFEPGTAGPLGVNPFDPNSAIPGAAKLLRQLHDQYGNWALALAAYNGGPGAINNGVASPETANYAQIVLGKAGVTADAPADATLTSADSTKAAQAEYGKLRQQFLDQGGTQLNLFNIDFQLSNLKTSTSTLAKDPAKWGWKGDSASFQKWLDAYNKADASTKTTLPVLSQLNSIDDFLAYARKFIGMLNNMAFWTRIGLAIGGLLVIGVGAWFLMGGFGDGGGRAKIVPVPV